MQSRGVIHYLVSCFVHPWNCATYCQHPIAEKITFFCKPNHKRFWHCLVGYIREWKYLYTLTVGFSLLYGTYSYKDQIYLYIGCALFLIDYSPCNVVTLRWLRNICRNIATFIQKGSSNSSPVIFSKNILILPAN